MSQFEDGATPLVDGIQVNYKGLPPKYVPMFRRYIEQGLDPGSGIKEVLSNSLRAVVAVDDTTLMNLPQIYRWVIFQCPLMAWGSPEKVIAWMRMRQIALQRARDLE
jgi:hypothetical protein